MSKIYFVSRATTAKTQLEQAVRCFDSRITDFDADPEDATSRQGSRCLDRALYSIHKGSKGRPLTHRVFGSSCILEQSYSFSLVLVVLNS